MEKVIKVGIHNRFDFVRRDAKTGEVLGEYKAENIILNGFWGKFLSTTSADCLKYIHFGSGTVPPVATDIKLTSPLGYRSPSTSALDYSKYQSDGIVLIKKSIRLQDNEFNGSFISEVGFGSTMSSTTGFMTKALVKDMNGNVVSIEKKSGEVLDIFATFYVNLGKGFDSGKINFGNVGTGGTSIAETLLFQRNWTALSCAYLQCRPQPQNPKTLPSGSYSVSPTVNPSFDVANKKLSVSVPNLLSSEGNISGGIRGLSVGSLLIDLPCTGITQPVLTKEVVGTGDGSNKDFQTAFGYIRDNGTAKVYVNDAEVVATIDYNQPCPATNISNYMKIIDYKRLEDDGVSIAYNPILGSSFAGFGWVTAEKPLNATITYVKGSYFNLLASEDGANWVTVVTNGTSNTNYVMNVPSEYQNYKYWKFESNGSANGSVTVINSDNAGAFKNIHLSTAPAVGDTVAVTYQPDCIAKDANHTLNNVIVTLSFNEYNPT